MNGSENAVKTFLILVISRISEILIGEDWENT